MLTIDLDKLPSYRIGERRGLEKGMEKGLEQGLQQGLEKGAHQKALAIAAELLAAGIAPVPSCRFYSTVFGRNSGFEKGQDGFLSSDRLGF